MRRTVFITGGTGYIGRALVPELVARGHDVTAVVRPQSAAKAPGGCRVIHGDALDSSTYAAQVPENCVFIHLVGVAHPSPWKAAEFRSIDLESLQQSVDAAARARVSHFVFMSVAQPAPVMRAYVAVRRECEERIRRAGLNATMIRPLYVLGPGHWWPYALTPVYKLLEAIPGTRDGAIRLGLVRLHEVLGAIIDAVENGATGVRIVETAEMRARSSSGARRAGSTR